MNTNMAVLMRAIPGSEMAEGVHWLSRRPVKLCPKIKSTTAAFLAAHYLSLLEKLT